MNRSGGFLLLVVFSVVFASQGCRSPYRSDQGALFGGLLGAGAGAIVGHELGNTGAGAAIGAGVGALTGAVVGQELDEIEAENRRMIASQMGRPAPAGAVTVDDVVEMTRAGVDDELIVSHVRANGAVRTPTTQDLISLQNQGVSSRVVKAMQEPPPRPVVVDRSPRPVIIREYHHDPYCYPDPYAHHYDRHYRGHREPAVRLGFTWHD